MRKVKEAPVTEDMTVDPTIAEAMAFTAEVRLEVEKLLLLCRALGPWHQGSGTYDVYSFDGQTDITKATNTGIRRDQDGHESPGEALGALILRRATQNTLNRLHAAVEAS